MKARVLQDGDITLIDGKTKRASNLKDVIKQNINCRLKTIKGECFCNVNHGLPFFSGILGESELSTRAIKDIISKNIISVNGVKSVDDLSFSFVKRSIVISYEVSTNYGELKGSL